MIKVCVKPQVKIIVFNDAILPGMKLLRERKEMKYIYMIETNCPSKKEKKYIYKKKSCLHVTRNITYKVMVISLC